MKMLKKITGFVLPILMIACAGNSGTDNEESNSQLPANPEHIAISWRMDAGMLPQGEKIYISSDSSYWESWNDQNIKHIPLVINQEELMDLYQVFLDNEFDLIGINDEEEVYDRGGTSLNIDVDGINFSKNNSGMSFIQEEFQKNFFAVENKVIELSNKKLEDTKILTQINIGERLYNMDYDLQITLDNNQIMVDESLNHSLELLPGDVDVEVYLFYKDSTNQYGGKATYKWENMPYSLSDSSNIMTIDFDDDGFLLSGDEY